MERILQQTNTIMSFDEFPKNLSIAATVVETLANEELIAYLRMYGNGGNNSVKNDEHKNRNNDYHGHDTNVLSHNVDNTNNQPKIIFNDDNSEKYGALGNIYMATRSSCSRYLEGYRYTPFEPDRKMEWRLMQPMCYSPEQSSISSQNTDHFNPSISPYNANNISHSIIDLTDNTDNDDTIADTSSNAKTESDLCSTLYDANKSCGNYMYHKNSDNVNEPIFGVDEISCSDDNFVLDDFPRLMSSNDSLPPFCDFFLKGKFTTKLINDNDNLKYA